MIPAILEQKDLQTLNTLATPARAEHFVELTEPDQLDALLAEARARGWPVTVLGEGSNVVLGDTVPGLTLRQCTRGIEVLDETPDCVQLRVSAGENWHRFVDGCLDKGFFGLENLALIPGTVGAAPIQNIGAYGVEVASFIERVECRRLSTGEAVNLDRAACEFGYRSSVFKQGWRDRLLVEAVVFSLPLVPDPVTHYPALSRWLEAADLPSPSPRQVFEAVVAIRSSRLPDPAVFPNVGSFFKNPHIPAEALAPLLDAWPALPHFDEKGGGYKLPAAWLIDQCGFRQLQRQPVRVHEEHALVIVNPEHRPAAQVIDFAREIATAVWDRFNIDLEQEPRSYGVAAVGGRG